MISVTQGVLGLASGALVGFSLGLVGGGGSILAVPLMVYVVGVPEPHVAIGTSAIAVAANAAINLSNHARGGTVVWSCALTFAAAGIVGAFLGSMLGKMIDGQKLLALFALVMLVIAVSDAEDARAGRPARCEDELVQHARHRRPRPCDRHGVRLLRHRRRLPDRAGADAGDGHADHERGQFLAGRGDRVRPDHGGELRLVGAGLMGAGGAVRRGRYRRRADRHPLGAHLSERRGALNIVFAVVIIAVALYMLVRNLIPILRRASYRESAGRPE